MAGAPQPFLIERESLAINPEVMSADVIDFLTLAGRSDLDSLRKAAELYRGPLLESFRLAEAAFDQWLSQERSRFLTPALSILTRLAEGRRSAG